jgi:hypothetical protein
MGPVGRIGLWVWDEILRCAQADRLGKGTRRRQELERGRRTRKKQVPPDKTRDSRRLSGARCCAPRQGRGRRNDNSRGVGALVMKLA